MKGLFKSKPKTPADLVRQTRDLLIYVDRGPDATRETKREEKVKLPFFFTLLFCLGFLALRFSLASFLVV